MNNTNTFHPYTLPPDIVRSSVKPDYDSQLIKYLKTLLPAETINRTIREYSIGVTANRDIIYFQLDISGACRTGKIMKYDAQTGHRIKDPNCPGRIGWIHTQLMKQGKISPDWQLKQCLFGEHLLNKYPDRTVALVEAEKTAIICSALMPEYIWLATGGKSQFNERIKVLIGRNVIAFPDVDAYDTWLKKTTEYPMLNLKISDILEKYATIEDRVNNIDIADWLLRYISTK